MNKPDLSLAQVEEAIGTLDRWAFGCHAASLALVRSGILPAGARVARGLAAGVRSQHTWAIVPTPYGVYDDESWVVDVTLWSYRPEAPRLYIAQAVEWPHIPHGYGSLRHMGPDPTGPILSLDVPVSRAVESFMHMYAPAGLDYKGWMVLMGGPMQGWPSKELVFAAYHTKAIRPAIPIDIVGMLTDENPHNLYF